MSIMRGPDPLNHQEFVNRMLHSGVDLEFMRNLIQQQQPQAQQQPASSRSVGASLGMNSMSFPPGISLPPPITQPFQQQPVAIAAQPYARSLISGDGAPGNGGSSMGLQVRCHHAPVS